MDQNSQLPQEQNTPPIPEETKAPAPIDTSTVAAQDNPLLQTPPPQVQPQEPTSVVNPQVPPQELPVQPQEMPKKKSSVFMLAIIVLLIAILALAGYYLWTKYLGGGKPVATPTPVAVVTPTATPDPTSDWETYTDPDNHYEFKYPKTLYKTDYIEGSYTGVQISSTNTGSSLEDGIMIKTLVVPSASAETFIQEQWNKDQNQPNFEETGSITKIDTSTLGNKTSYTYTVSFMGNVKVVVIQLSSDTILQIAGYYSGASDAKISNYLQQVDQIFSTFKLIEATPSGSPTSSPSATLQ